MLYNVKCSYGLPEDATLTDTDANLMFLRLPTSSTSNVAVEIPTMATEHPQGGLSNPEPGLSDSQDGLWELLPNRRTLFEVCNGHLRRDFLSDIDTTYLVRRRVIYSFATQISNDSRGSVLRTDYRRYDIHVSIG